LKDYALVRSKRKTIAIHVFDDRVEVRAPQRVPKHEIDRFVASKEKWIEEKLLIMHEQAARRKAFAPTYGDKMLLCGREYPAVSRSGNRSGFDGEAFFMPPDLTSSQIKSVCVQIYRRLAKTGLVKRTLDFAEQVGVSPTAIRISGAKKRWGSCSAKGSINYSWRLMMADTDVIDYVVVHELAHLKYMDHSKQFWTTVESVLPDWRERRKRLRELQKRLSAESWEE